MCNNTKDFSTKAYLKHCSELWWDTWDTAVAQGSLSNSNAAWKACCCLVYNQCPTLHCTLLVICWLRNTCGCNPTAIWIGVLDKGSRVLCRLQARTPLCCTLCWRALTWRAMLLCWPYILAAVFLKYEQPAPSVPIKLLHSSSLLGFFMTCLFTQ